MGSGLPLPDHEPLARSCSRRRIGKIAIPYLSFGKVPLYALAPCARVVGRLVGALGPLNGLKFPGPGRGDGTRAVPAAEAWRPAGMAVQMRALQQSS